MAGAFVKVYVSVQSRLTPVLCFQKEVGYIVPLRDPVNEAETPEMLEAERQAEQDEIDNGQYDKLLGLVRRSSRILCL